MDPDLMCMEQISEHGQQLTDRDQQKKLAPKTIQNCPGYDQDR